MALHHIDCPWKPSAIEQREGRGLRQGNQNTEVAVYRYVTKNTFDAYLWGVVENKQRFISQVMTSKELARNCEDIDETVLNFAEIKAVASGNPLIMEKIQTDSEATRLRVLKAAYDGKRYMLQDAFLVQYPKQIAAKEKELKSIQGDIRERNAEMAKNASFEITLLDMKFTGHKEAGQELRRILAGIKLREVEKIGTYKGFTLSVQRNISCDVLRIHGNNRYDLEIKESDTGNMVRLENLVNGLDKRAEDRQEKIKICHTEMKNAEMEYRKPFPYEQQLKEVLKRQAEINTRLEIREDEEHVGEMQEKEPSDKGAQEKEASEKSLMDHGTVVLPMAAVRSGI